MFNKTRITDKHIVDAIDIIGKKDPAAKAAVIKRIEDAEKKLEGMQKISPILYDTIYDNVIESEVFNEMQKIKDLDVGAPRFNVPIFTKLNRKIKSENASIFPLKSFADFKLLHSPRIILVPAPNHPEFNDVNTAAATADGSFIFCVPFMQTLLDYAHVKGIKINPKSHGASKYASRGGDIPDEYEYIEFLILHEYYHFVYSDFHYQKILKEPMKIINWVGDFRTNHKLVDTKGLNQLPIGLFSQHINFKKQSSYQEMVDIVKRELDKFPKEKQDEIKEMMDEMTDDHSKGGEGGDSQKGEGKSIEDIENHAKEVGEGNEPADGEGGEEGKGKSKKSGNGKGDTPVPGAGTLTTIEKPPLRAKYNWKQLLAKMIGDSGEDEESYRKISRRAVTGAVTAIATGKAAMKPGIVQVQNSKRIKLAVIVDSSGSMSSVIAQVMSNLEQLLMARGSSRITEEFYFIVFSDTHEVYSCTLGTNGTFRQVTDIKNNSGGAPEHGKLTTLLSRHRGGGTVFGSAIVSDAQKLLAQGYNVLLVTDTDITYGENLTNFAKLYAAHRKHVFLMLDSAHSFQIVGNALKEVSNNMTHL